MSNPIKSVWLDDAGRISQVNAKITKRNLDTGKNVTQSGRNRARETGLEGDHAAHIIGKNLGGHGRPSNIVSLAPNVNRGPYKGFENWVKKSVGTHNGTEATVRFDYKGNSQRPSMVHVDGKNSKGQKYSDSFANRSSSKKSQNK